MNNNREKLLFILVAIVLGLFAGDRLLLQPYLGSWKKHGDNITKLKDQLNKGNRLRSRERIIRADWDSKKENSLPLDENLAQDSVLTAVRRWGTESGVSLNYTSSRPREEDTFTSIEGKLDITGSMSQVLRFLYQVEKDPLAIRVKSFDIDSKDNGQTMSMGMIVSGLILTKPDK